MSQANLEIELEEKVVIMNAVTGSMRLQKKKMCSLEIEKEVLEKMIEELRSTCSDGESRSQEECTEYGEMLFYLICRDGHVRRGSTQK